MNKVDFVVTMCFIALQGGAMLAVVWTIGRELVQWERRQQAEYDKYYRAKEAE